MIGKINIGGQLEIQRYVPSDHEDGFRDAECPIAGRDIDHYLQICNVMCVFFGNIHIKDGRICVPICNGTVLEFDELIYETRSPLSCTMEN